MAKALFVHGMLADQRVWREVTPELPDLDCRFVELPGHGDAVDWDGGDYQTQAYRMAEVACGVGKEPVHLVGHSFGATVALRLAVERPELLLSLTLIDPVFFYAARQGQPEMFQAYRARSAPVMEAIVQGEFLHAAELFIRDWGVEGAWAHLPESVREGIAAKMRLVATSGPSIAEDTGNIWARLGRIKCPVALIMGGRSEPIMRGVKRGLEAEMTVDCSVVIENAGHMIPLTHGKLLGQHLAAFTS